jgi:Protein of unknown function DUF262
MKVSTILDHIDSGHMALPEFQRGYVWNRDQVRGLYGSLYRRHPVGGLLVWATESKAAEHRGDGPLAGGVVKLLLDGQQRMTTLYGVVRGKPPKFFDGNPQAFTGLRFHLDTETFSFWQPVKMQDDPLWIDLTELMQRGSAGLGDFVARLSQQPALASGRPRPGVRPRGRGTAGKHGPRTSTIRRSRRGRLLYRSAAEREEYSAACLPKYGDHQLGKIGRMLERERIHAIALDGVAYRPAM